MQLIDGKQISSDIKKEFAEKSAKIIDSGKRAPHIAAILVGNDPASLSYVNSKEKAAKSVGFTSTIYKLDEKTTEKQLIEFIDFLNKDDEVDGFIVQLPLPKHINTDKVVNRINPKKDVDGFHPHNLGLMVTGDGVFFPATPLGITKLLKRSGIKTEGKHCVVVGRSNIVGTPISIMLSRKLDFGNATVTLCHSKTENLEFYTKQADILIVAVGSPELIKADMVKEGVVVIDVGIHRIPDESKKGYHITGDVDFKEVSKKASYITPVPGGVGPMTIVSLLQNTLTAYEKFGKNK